MPLRALRLLLIEDDKGHALLTQALLSECSEAEFIVDWVTRVAEGIDRIQAGGIDLLLMDLSLPDGQGIPLLRKMRETFPKLPVIVLTSYDDPDNAQECLAAGALGYLIKGQVEADVLSRTILEAIDRKPN
jgi:DNA-binding NarL/FixJ family response regulator